MRLLHQAITVRAAATISGCGAGVGQVAFPIEVRDTFHLSLSAGPSRVTTWGSENKWQAPATQHPFIRALAAFLEEVGAPLAGFDLHIHPQVMRAAGFGTSALTIAAALAAGRTIVGAADDLSDLELAQFAAKIGADPLRVWAGLGNRLALSAPGPGLQLLRAPIDPGLPLSIFAASATQARRPLIDQGPPDWTATQGEAARASATLLPLALSTNPELLFAASADPVYLPQLSGELADSAAMIKALRKLGHPAFLIGAGPSIGIFANLEQAFLDEAANCGWTPLTPAVASEPITVKIDE